MVTFTLSLNRDILECVLPPNYPLQTAPSLFVRGTSSVHSKTSNMNSKQNKARKLFRCAHSKDEYTVCKLFHAAVMPERDAFEEQFAQTNYMLFSALPNLHSPPNHTHATLDAAQRSTKGIYFTYN